MPEPLPTLTSKQIVELRPGLKRPSPSKEPLDVIVEPEPLDKQGYVGNAATLFLVGSECRFRCLMCDLWQFTHSEATPEGHLPLQVKAGLRTAQEKLDVSSSSQGQIDCIKLYNASNFFATSNVPERDMYEIGNLVAAMPRVVVENHPSILNSSICSFRDALGGKLEVALGLETTHPEVLPRLNKSMDLDCFRRCADWLGERQIDTRAFVLLSPPGLGQDAAVESCLETIRFAEACEVRHVSVIPTRRGNGAIDHLEKLGLFSPPTAGMLETVMQHVQKFSCIVTADLWDWAQLAGHCPTCREARRTRLDSINLTQTLQTSVGLTCSCHK